MVVKGVLVLSRERGPLCYPLYVFCNLILFSYGTRWNPKANMFHSWHFTLSISFAIEIVLYVYDVEMIVMNSEKLLLMSQEMNPMRLL